MAQNKSLSTQEVADILHVSKSTIYELIRRGEINSYKVGRKVRFTQDDVDAYIARSRHEQSVHPVRRVEISSELLHPATDKGDKPFIISGQDVVLDILSNFLHQNGLGTDRCYLNSFEGLLALYEKKVDAAACHLYAVDEKSFNVPYVKRLMPGVKAVLIKVSYRKQGYYVAAGNPKEIRGWLEDELIDYVATDQHNCTYRRSRMREAYRALKEEYGVRYANRLVGLNRKRSGQGKPE